MEANVGEGPGYEGKGCRLCNKGSSPKLGGGRHDMAFFKVVEAAGILYGGECRVNIR